MRPNVASAGAVMSIGSSATNTRPSGAAQTTEGCLTAGAAATSSRRQFGSVLGNSALQLLWLATASTKKNADGQHDILIPTLSGDRSVYPVKIVPRTGRRTDHSGVRTQSRRENRQVTMQFRPDMPTRGRQHRVPEKPFAQAEAAPGHNRLRVGHGDQPA